MDFPLRSVRSVKTKGCSLSNRRKILPLDGLGKTETLKSIGLSIPVTTTLKHADFLEQLFCVTCTAKLPGLVATNV